MGENPLFLEIPLTVSYNQTRKNPSTIGPSKFHQPKTPFKASDATWAQAGAAALQQRQKVVRGDFFGEFWWSLN